MHGNRFHFQQMWTFRWSVVGSLDGGPCLVFIIGTNHIHVGNLLNKGLRPTNILAAIFVFQHAIAVVIMMQYPKYEMMDYSCEVNVRHAFVER